MIGETLPEASGFVVSQIDLNNGSVEGLRHRTLPTETVQLHPEGGPGPLDALAVFDRFVAAARARHGGTAPEATVGRVEPVHLDGRAGEATARYGVTESGERVGDGDGLRRTDWPSANGRPAAVGRH